MFSTSYKSPQSIGKSYGPYLGGLCKWWYTFIQHLDGFPVIDPLTQQLSAEPILKAGKNWYGPVNVPDRQLGWEEQSLRSPAGQFYRQKINGFSPGLDIINHINQQNVSKHQIIVVAKLRAGGFFIVLGNNRTGMDLDHSTGSGLGSSEIPGTKLQFSIDTKDKALVLSSFQGEDSVPPPIFGININRSDMEFYDFNPAGDTVINWTPEMVARFGAYPTIEVWPLDPDTGNYYRGAIPIDAQGDPPVSFTIRNNGGLGKIKIM